MKAHDNLASAGRGLLSAWNIEAQDAFGGDEKKAVECLRSPVRHLGGGTPLEVLATESRTALVRESIVAIANGGVG